MDPEKKIAELEEAIAAERQARFDLANRVDSLISLQTELVFILRGNWGVKGLVSHFDAFSERLDRAESTLNRSKAFFAGVVFAGSIAGSAIGALLGYTFRAFP